MSWTEYFRHCRDGNLLGAFDSLAGAGVLPVVVGEDKNGKIKRPLVGKGEAWEKIPTSDWRTRLVKFIDECVPVGIGCKPTGHLVIDIDPKGKDPAGLAVAFEQTCQMIFGKANPPETLIVKTAGGCHIWFSLSFRHANVWQRFGRKTVKLPCGGKAEFFVGNEHTGHQVACAPSDGKTIAREVIPAELSDEAYAAIEDAVGLEAIKAGTAPKPLSEVPFHEDYNWTVEVLTDGYVNTEIEDYDKWLRVGMILENKFGERGVDLWEMWSSGSSKHKPGECFEKAKTFKRSGGTMAKFGTLVDIVRKNGGPEPKSERPFDSPSTGSFKLQSQKRKRHGGDQAQPEKHQQVKLTAQEAAAALIPFHDPYHLAKTYAMHQGESRSVTWKGTTYQWIGGKYVEVRADTLKAQIGSFTDHYFLVHAENELAAATDPEDRAKVQKRPVTASVVQSVTQAFLSVSIVDEQRLRTMPGWIDPMATDWNPDETIALADCLLNVRTSETRPITSRWFSRTRSPVHWNGGVVDCPGWLAFLDSVFPGDPDSTRLLQQFFGLCLTSDTSWQKILSLVGPPRSGKGTIGKVLHAILGDGAVASLGLGDLSREFGLEKLIGSPVAIMPDVRFGNRENIADAVERLLSISGEDEIRIARKYQPDWSGKLPTRIIMASNEMPRLPDAAAALPTRLLTLHFTESFVGREDSELIRRIMSEIESILAWAVEGYKDLVESGQFAANSATGDAAEEAKEIGSPMAGFMRECLDITHSADDVVSITDIYRAYQGWCAATGHKPSSQTTMVKQVMDLEPKIRKARPGLRGSNRNRVLVGIRIANFGVPIF